MKVSLQQRRQWYSEKKCHVCGSKIKGHTHPNWMWIANAIPETKAREVAELEKIVGAKANQEELTNIVLGKR